VNGGDAAVFETSNEADQVIKVKAMADDSAFVLLAGQPINEPIFSRGPFVLSSAEELQQTFYDYSYGVNGFEGAQGWESQN